MSATVVVNGRDQQVAEGETLAGLLQRLGLGARFALVERYGEPVERTRYEAKAVREGRTPCYLEFKRK